MKKSTKKRMFYVHSSTNTFFANYNRLKVLDQRKTIQNGCFWELPSKEKSIGLRSCLKIPDKFRFAQ